MTILLIVCYLTHLHMYNITKHAYIMLTPLNHHFYIVKLWFTGVHIIVLISFEKNRL